MEPSIKAIILRVVHLDSVIPVLGYLDEPIDEYANGGPMEAALKTVNLGKEPK